MNTYRIYQVDAFTRTKFEGNPAGVVANADGLSDKQMQSIARELNNSETAFILSPDVNSDAEEHDIWVRFFSPMTEVPICGHATVSAHYVYAMENNLPSCVLKQKVAIGILPVEIIQNYSVAEDHGDYSHGDYSIMMTQGEVEISPTVSKQINDDILLALGISEADRDQRCPIQVSSTGHSKVMIGINSEDTLHELTPNMSALASISESVNSNGFFVFALNDAAMNDKTDDSIISHGRMFAPAIGINEDPVTGNANGPLGAYLVKHKILEVDQNGDDQVSFRAIQGEAMGRPGIVNVIVDSENGLPVKVRIGGDAVIAFKTEISV
ncbi:PhzF family isomerase [Cocleimonas flava]|uniref:PhzF family phenazine biosynthesis protein n=1 Tax=Cocleimonas flava TaxID=634765 RepID=A0A4R1EVF1_9GAMM|nr:PhzF family isomerase [Cocleimonas flava]TCJ84680.1 PhzF family phenazine biosynthesis protein [Cocleimonas flava]